MHSTVDSAPSPDAPSKLPRREKSASKGYLPEDPKMLEELRALMRPDTHASLVAFGQEWAIIGLTATGTWVLLQAQGLTPLSGACTGLSLLVIARGQRALENLVHEATHYNLSPNRRLNDVLGWALGALPLFHNLDTERAGHLAGHHARFWNPAEDPDWKRYLALGADKLGTGVRPLVQALTGGLATYFLGTVKTFFLPAGEQRRQRLLRLGFWSAVLAVAGATNTLVPLALFWGVPFLFVLTPLRFFAELEEHGALSCANEFKGTRNNLGWIHEWFLHPRGDAFHLAHHLYQRLPHHQMAQAHRILMRDREYRERGQHCHSVRDTLRALIGR
jgi:fatty acid desaturase